MIALMQTPSGGRPHREPVSCPIQASNDQEALDQLIRDSQRSGSVLSPTGRLVDWRRALEREVGR